MSKTRPTWTDVYFNNAGLICYRSSAAKLEADFRAKQSNSEQRFDDLERWSEIETTLLFVVAENKTLDNG